MFVAVSPSGFLPHGGSMKQSQVGSRVTALVAAAVLCLYGMSATVLAQGSIMSVDPARLGQKVRVNYGVEKRVTVTLTNTYVETIHISNIGWVRASLTDKDWLDVSATSFDLPVGGAKTFDIILNKNGVLVYTPGTVYTLAGLVSVKWDVTMISDSFNIVIDNIEVTDTTIAPSPVIWDTLTTGCTRLIVSDRGEVGRIGQPRVSMDFVSLGGDCDSSADVYLYDGGPIVIRKSGTDYIFSTPLFEGGQQTEESFRPTTLGPPAGEIAGPGYTGFRTGTLVNKDSSIGLIRTYYAPSVADSCNFIIQKTVFFGIGGPQSHVTLGEVVDWDIPSYADQLNDGHTMGSRLMVYEQGRDTSTSGCQQNTSRLGAVKFLLMYTPAQHNSYPCFNDYSFYGSYLMDNDTLYKYDGDTTGNDAKGAYFWNQMGALPGLSSFVAVDKDLHSVVTYKYDIPSLDTLTVYTALVTVQNGDTAALRIGIDKTYAWYYRHLRTKYCDSPPCLSCCCSGSADGRAGNVDCDPGKGVDISDLSTLIDYLFVSFTPLCCESAADFNGDGNVDIEDVTRCIEWLYICFGCLPTMCRS